jgi:hypothetical protein
MVIRCNIQWLDHTVSRTNDKDAQILGIMISKFENFVMKFMIYVNQVYMYTL